MADNYLEKKMEDYQAQPAVRRRATASLARLLRANRSYRGYDNSFVVREDQLRRIIDVARLSLAHQPCPAAPGHDRRIQPQPL